jgi:hypothetical protein
LKSAREKQQITYKVRITADFSIETKNREGM